MLAHVTGGLCILRIKVTSHLSLIASFALTVLCIAYECMGSTDTTLIDNALYLWDWMEKRIYRRIPIAGESLYFTLKTYINSFIDYSLSWALAVSSTGSSLSRSVSPPTTARAAALPCEPPPACPLATSLSSWLA